MLYKEGLRSGLSDFGILVPIPQEKKDKVISLKCCHSELGLELAEHRDSCESPVTIDPALYHNPSAGHSWV